jgi:hypothetical protein
MTEKRFMVDDAGSLIDMEEMKYYDIVEEVCPVLNDLHEENESNKHLLKVHIAFCKSKGYELKDIIDFVVGEKND